jgi:hypothetical protein
MSDEAQKKLDEILEKNKKIETDITHIKKYMPLTDVVENEKYCEIRTAYGAELKLRGLFTWFTKGCPRIDSRHVSISEVNEWARVNNTRAPKKK